MRISAFVFALAMVLAVPALARRGVSGYQTAPATGPAKSDEEPVAEARRSEGLKDLRRFGEEEQPKEKPFPWLAMSIALAAGLLATPFAYRMYQTTRSDLEDQSTFGMRAGRRSEHPSADSAESREAPQRLSRRPASREAGETRIVGSSAAAQRQLATAAPSARDAIWTAVSSANGWVTVNWVATATGLSADEVTDEIRALAAEGHLKETRDRSGTPVYRSRL
jgi:hypothetical protein